MPPKAKITKAMILDTVLNITKETGFEAVNARNIAGKLQCSTRPIFTCYENSCASLLLANGVPMKQIQEWLGHSDFSTTANIYAHLDYSSKLLSVQAMVSGMALPENVDFGSKWENVAEKCRG